MKDPVKLKALSRNGLSLEIEQAEYGYLLLAPLNNGDVAFSSWFPGLLPALLDAYKLFGVAPDEWDFVVNTDDRNIIALPKVKEEELLAV